MKLDDHISGSNRLNQDSFVYRIMPLCYLLDLFEEEKNVLVKPQKWKDPFENFIVKSENVYGQCWTLNKASDSLWQIYSPNSDSIRIQSRVRTLVTGLRDAVNDASPFRVFIRKVLYPLEEDIKKFANSLNSHAKPFSNETVASALSVKKRAFKCEEEVRLFFFNAASSVKDCFRYRVDPKELVNQILIDPRMSSKRYDTLKNRLLKRTGLTDEQIKHSRVYDPPPGMSRYSQNGERL